MRIPTVGVGRLASFDPARTAAISGAFEAAGPPDAPALVLLHGTRHTRAMWKPQVAHLSDTFRVLAVDLPAHGALADLPFRLGDASRVIAELIGTHTGGRAIVVGHSLGGYVAMDLGARWPERVAGLVLANATCEPRTVARRAPRVVGSYLLGAASDHLRARAVGAAGLAGNRNGGDGGASHPCDETRTADAATSMRSATGSAAPEAASVSRPRLANDPPATNGWLMKGGTRALVAALGQAYVPRLAAYPGPTLILNGGDDSLFRRGEQAFLAAAAHGRLEIIPGAGHEISFDQPEAFNRAVRRFATDVLRAGTEVAAAG